MFDRAHREKYFPHIKTLIFATHSTIFLDRQHITNNYSVEKRGDEIIVQRIESRIEFNRIHFFLLGNRFETLYLPSAILIVEGKCDYKFIERAVTSQYSTSQVSIISANGDGRIKEVLHIARQLLTDIQKSPYRDRIFVVLDSVHASGLPEQIVAMGVPRENVVLWPRNGIEYYYPPSIIDQIFGGGAEIVINGDIVSRNGISHTKSELVEKVIAQLQHDTAMHSEFRTLLLGPLEAALGSLEH